MPNVGVTPASFVVQFIGRFFHVHDAAEAARVFVVFVFVFVFESFQLLQRESSRPTGDALLPLLSDYCLFSAVNSTNIVGRCEPFLGSEYPSSLPACATVQLAHQPDPPVLPTGLVVRISMTLPQGSLTSASVRTSARYAQVTGARRSTEF